MIASWRKLSVWHRMLLASPASNMEPGNPIRTAFAGQSPEDRTEGKAAKARVQKQSPEQSWAAMPCDLWETTDWCKRCAGVSFAETVWLQHHVGAELHLWIYDMQQLYNVKAKNPEQQSWQTSTIWLAWGSTFLGPLIWDQDLQILGINNLWMYNARATNVGSGSPHALFENLAETGNLQFANLQRKPWTIDVGSACHPSTNLQIGKLQLSY